MSTHPDSAPQFHIAFYQFVRLDDPEAAAACVRELASELLGSVLLPDYIEAHVPEWKAAGKRVAMYCTGGIRCEKTSAWMQDMGVPVYQLEGGILNYFLQMPDADRDWEGECFVFDNRIALDTHLQETATTPDEVYGGVPEWEWRLQRARRLDEDSE
jgi:UPF0176 protein